jgi:hypothetical protein
LRSAEWKEVEVMCDCALMGVPNRIAVEGEQLVVHRFRNGLLGLAVPDNLA